MDPSLQYKARHSDLELEDLVTKFVEEKLGRHDWASNWPVWKSKQDGGGTTNHLDVIRNWFHQLGEDVDPNLVCRKIDNMILTRPGRWR